MKTKLLITGLALMALTMVVSAQDQGAGQKQQNQTGKGSAWVDANNNGVCDNYEAQKSACPRGNGSGNFRGTGQGKGKGLGPCGTGQGRGNQKNFVDTDKNGICDFRETPSKK